MLDHKSIQRLLCILELHLFTIWQKALPCTAHGNKRYHQLGDLLVLFETAQRLSEEGSPLLTRNATLLFSAVHRELNKFHTGNDAEKALIGCVQQVNTTRQQVFREEQTPSEIQWSLWNIVSDLLDAAEDLLPGKLNDADAAQFEALLEQIWAADLLLQEEHGGFGVGPTANDAATRRLKIAHQQVNELLPARELLDEGPPVQVLFSAIAELQSTMLSLREPVEEA